MRVWAISDLHLSFARPAPRERFARRWKDHADRIERHWRDAVAAEDLVLLPGDLSMAWNHREVQPDLEWLERLPGQKVLAPGNHDRWWNKIEAVSRLMRPSLHAVEGARALTLEGLVLCGARGLAYTGEETESTKALASPTAIRALECLDVALAAAQAARTSREPIVLLWHFPPFDAHGRPGPCVSRCVTAGVSLVVYGHWHTEGQWSAAFHGVHEGIQFCHVAADAIGFRPLPIPIPLAD